MRIIEKKRQRIRGFQKPDLPRDFAFGVLSLLVLLLLGMAGVVAELLWGSTAPAGRQGEQT